jgi:hypothetical protein
MQSPATVTGHRHTPRRVTGHRFDRTLRVVMWLDAFLSVEVVAVGAIASPVVAVLGVPSSILFAVAMASIVCAVLLAAFGAITAVVLMLRMRDGHYLLPDDLNLRPLPAGMRPELARTAGAT